MANHTTGAQRYNARMHKIFEDAKLLQAGKPLPQPAERPVFVDGQPKGVVFKLASRWRWRRGADKIATETYARGETLADVMGHIARVCNGQRVTIKLRT